MSSAFKCDICNSFHDGNPFTMVVYGNVHQKSVKIDLCENCMYGVFVSLNNASGDDMPSQLVELAELVKESDFAKDFAKDFDSLRSFISETL